MYRGTLPTAAVATVSCTSLGTFAQGNEGIL